MVKNGAETIYIGCSCELRVTTSCLFWRHVTRRAERFNHCARNRTFSLDKPCQAKISKMRFALCIYQDVPRLDISMQDPPLVGIMNSARKFDNEFGCTPIRHWLAL